MKQKKTTDGFTLIELLVVVSIIGILSSFAVVSLNSARNKARDALRKADMTQIRTALALYYDDNNEYPTCGSWEGAGDFGATAACYNVSANNSGTLGDVLTGGARPYLSPLPKDPKNKDNKPAAQGGDDTYLYRYVSKADGSEYALVYQIEDNADLQIIRGW